MTAETEKNLDQIVASFEHNIIKKALKDTHGNQSEAARVLGISKRKIQYKIKKYAIQCRNFKEHDPDDVKTFFSWHPLSEAYNKEYMDIQSLLLP